MQTPPIPPGFTTAPPQGVPPIPPGFTVAPPRARNQSQAAAPIAPQTAPTAPAQQGAFPLSREERIEALFAQYGDMTKAVQMADEQIRFEGLAPSPLAGQDSAPVVPARPAYEITVSDPIQTDEQGAFDLTNPTAAMNVMGLRQGDRVTLPGGRTETLSAQPFVSPQRADDEQVGGFLLRQPNALDATGAFVSGAAEQVPFLDEGAVLADALLSGQSYSDARDDYQVMQQMLNQTNRGERVAGGLAGFAASLAAPGVGAGSRFIQGGANAADKVLRAGGLGALGGAVFGAGGAEGGLGDRAEAAALGAALGAGTGGVLQGAVNRVQRPVQETAQRRLSRQGQELTLGQMLGGGAQRVEDAFTSLPFAGDVIRDRQRDVLSSFDNVATNAAISGLGQTLADTSGRQGVRSADDVISGAYKRALANVSVDPADPALAASLQQARNPQNLTANDAAELNSTLDNILSRAQGVIDGDTWKRIDSDLAAAARSADAGAATRPTMSAIRDRLQEARTAWRDALGRVDMAALEGVSAADAAEAQYRLVRKASSDVASAARGGDASPATLNRAVVANANDRRVARGESLLQDLTDDAMQVLPRTVPDSGTPLRSLVTGGTLGVGGAALGVDPVALALAGALTGGVSGLYSKPVQRLANRLYRMSDRGGTTPDAALLSQMLLRSGQIGAQGVPDAQTSRQENRRARQ